MWKNAAFKAEVQKVMWCSKAPHIQLQGWGRLGAEVKLHMWGVSDAAPRTCWPTKWGCFCFAGLLWCAGFASVLQQSGFWQSTCEKCTNPLDWVECSHHFAILVLLWK